MTDPHHAPRAVLLARAATELDAGREPTPTLLALRGDAVLAVRSLATDAEAGARDAPQLALLPDGTDRVAVSLPAWAWLLDPLSEAPDVRPTPDARQLALVVVVTDAVGVPRSTTSAHPVRRDDDRWRLAAPLTIQAQRCDRIVATLRRLLDARARAADPAPRPYARIEASGGPPMAARDRGSPRPWACEARTVR